MTSAITTAEPRPIELDAAGPFSFRPRSYREMIWIARQLFEGGLLPRSITSAQAAFTVIQAGGELELFPMQSLRLFHVIEGRAVPSAGLFVALCKRSPLCLYFHLAESTDEVVRYVTHRRGDPELTTLTWTRATAERAGLWGRGTWAKYPGQMLRARCGSDLARAVYPDLVGGLYAADELGLEEPMEERPRRAPRAWLSEEPPSKNTEKSMEAPTSKNADVFAETTQKPRETPGDITPPPSAPLPPDSAEGLPPMEAELIRQLFEAAEPGSPEWAAAKERRAQAAKARTITQREHAELGELARRRAEEHAAKVAPTVAPEPPPEPERHDGEVFRAIEMAYRGATTKRHLDEADTLCTSALTDGRLTRTQGKALLVVRKVAADRIAKTEQPTREPGEEG